MKIAVITGASSGMGREFARQLERAEDFDEMWLIARRADELNALAGELRSKSRVLPLDLEQEASCAAYQTLLAEVRPEIAVLVNAAGFGRFAALRNCTMAEIHGMMALNDRALVDMTMASLPYMGRGSRVYQLGSMSSFEPVPYMTLYGASKAFVLSFSRALNMELKPDGIRMMAVCPGWVQTPFFDRAKQDDTVSYIDRLYSPNEVVERALRDMARGKDLSICGLHVRLQVLMIKLLPHPLVMRIWCKQQKKPWK